ncbi:nanos homolog 2 [Discoglossus pictus]
MDFQPWKDYFQLSTLVKEMAIQRGKSTPNIPTSQNLLPHLATEEGTSNGNPQTHDQGQRLCNFCKHNGESSLVYTSHSLKNSHGVVECPVLRKYVCPMCGATGDSSHTLKYCPLNEEKHCLYRKSGRNSAGRRVKR